MLLKRNKKLASIILIAGLSLGVVGCGNNKDNKETSKVDTKVESTVSKNDAEKEDKTEENNNISDESNNKLDEENKDINNTNTSSNNISSSTSKPSTNTSSNSTSSSTSKPSTNTSSNSTSSSTSKPSTNTSSNNTESSTSKPSTNTSSNNTESSTSKPSTNKPSNSTSDSTSKPAERTWEYMSGLSQETFNALNAYRQANGVAPLKYSSTEQSRANNSAKISVETEKSYHETLQISLANNTGSSSSFINQWESSSSHKKSMLDGGFTEGAVSVYKDSKGHYYVVASFHLDW